LTASDRPAWTDIVTSLSSRKGKLNPLTLLVEIVTFERKAGEAINALAQRLDIIRKNCIRKEQPLPDFTYLKKAWNFTHVSEMECLLEWWNDREAANAINKKSRVSLAEQYKFWESVTWAQYCQAALGEIHCKVKYEKKFCNSAHDFIRQLGLQGKTDGRYKSSKPPRRVKKTPKVITKVKPKANANAKVKTSKGCEKCRKAGLKEEVCKSHASKCNNKLREEKVWEASKDSAHKRKVSGKKCESCRKSGIVRRVRNHLNHNTKDCRNDPKDRVITIRTGKFKTNRHMVTESNVTNRTLMILVSSKRRNPARSDGITITGRSCEYCSTCGIKEPHEDCEGLCETCDRHGDGGVTFQLCNKAERLQAWLEYWYEIIPEGKQPTWKGSKPKWEQRPINARCITCKFCQL
jgi:hypothetical protein